MNSFGTYSRLSLIAILLFATSCLTYGTGSVRTVKRPHPQRIEAARNHVANQKLPPYQQQTLRSSSGAPAHNATIVFKKQLADSNGVYFLDDMESGVNGWTVDTPSDTLWHLTTADHASPTHSWWCGVDSTGTYNSGNRVNQSLVSPPIDLTTAAWPIRLVFNERFDTEPGHLLKRKNSCC